MKRLDASEPSSFKIAEALRADTGYRFDNDVLPQISEARSFATRISYDAAFLSLHAQVAHTDSLAALDLASRFPSGDGVPEEVQTLVTGRDTPDALRSYLKGFILVDPKVRGSYPYAFFPATATYDNNGTAYHRDTSDTQGKTLSDEPLTEAFKPDGMLYTLVRAPMSRRSFRRLEAGDPVHRDQVLAALKMAAGEHPSLGAPSNLNVVFVPTITVLPVRTEQTGYVMNFAPQLVFPKVTNPTGERVSHLSVGWELVGRHHYYPDTEGDIRIGNNRGLLTVNNLLERPVHQYEPGIIRADNAITVVSFGARPVVVANKTLILNTAPTFPYRSSLKR